ncbi:uncharacterized protein PV09_04240 [Verruconis gallopava]|uniref:CCD97-like C-terminal domain-containing protein n=1 Tax=Verruconis gallopava TaxID=253628 RepID=A0A0D1XPJ6_9PEZI|nr:uncharacterized protein PV09_04240 [Verruconis gallopava]KIW04481.1 hypothetical protein PV09_04240 [Verruconis gallopava]
MPYIWPKVVTIMDSQDRQSPPENAANTEGSLTSRTTDRVRVKNRRLRYLELHPEYFGPSLELADPLMYDRLIRRFQSSEEREAEGRKKGYSGILEADLWRAEARLDALHNPNSSSVFQYRRGANGEVLVEEQDDVPQSKEEGFRTWKYEMEMRFLRGDDDDFDYDAVDNNELFDDKAEEERVELDKYLADEEPEFILEHGQEPQGETGIQDF